ncbi:MAG: hypothetical protein V4773_15175 [Verrucomicrobiota bacterium]
MSPNLSSRKAQRRGDTSAPAPRASRPRSFLPLPAILVLTGSAVIGWHFSRSPATSDSIPQLTTKPAPATPSGRALASISSDTSTISAADTPFASAFAALRAKLGPAASPEDTMRALTELALTQPALALDLAHALGQTEEEKSMWVVDLARQWTERDPRQAWAWLGQQDSTRIRTLGTGTLPEVIVGTLARAQPALLVSNLDALLQAGESPLGVSPVVAVHLSLEALTSSGQLALARATVERWAADPTRPAMGEAAYVTVAAALAQADAAQAGAWLKNLPPSAARDIALVEFPAQMAQQQSPRAALDWAEGNIAPELRARALQRTFSDWVEAAPADAGDWLGGYLSRSAPSPETDRLVATLVNLGSAIKTSPATALQWSALVSDSAARSSLEEKVALRWARLDRDAAVRYISAHPDFSPARKQTLLQQVQHPAPSEG